MTGNYKDNPILTCLIYAVFGLVLGFGVWWAL